MKKNLSKLYDRLTGEERFKLTLAAIARGDKGELEHLKQTCPRYDYRIMDPACADRFELSMIIALAFSMDWISIERSYIIMMFCLKVMAFMPCIFDNKAIYLLDFKDDREASLNTGLTERCIAELTEKKIALKSVQTALEIFCQEVDVPLEHMLVWAPDIYEWINEYKPTLADVEPDEVVVDSYIALYHQLWTAKTGQTFTDPKPAA